LLLTLNDICSIVEQEFAVAMSGPSEEEYKSAAVSFFPVFFNLSEKIREEQKLKAPSSVSRAQNAISRLAVWFKSVIAIKQQQPQSEELELTLGIMLEQFAALPLKQIQYLLGIKDDHTPEFPQDVSSAENSQIRLGFVSGYPDRLQVPNSAAYIKLRFAVAHHEFFKTDGSVYPAAYLHGRDLEGRAELRPVIDSTSCPDEEARQIQRMFELCQKLSDRDADVLDALSDNFINNASEPNDLVSITIDYILRKRGICPRKNGRGGRGGYKATQRDEIQCSLETIENLWLDLEEIEVFVPIGRGKKKVRRLLKLQSRAFVILERKAQQRIDGSLDVHEITYTIGPVFSAFLFGRGRQIALLSSKTLTYDLHTEKYPKRLSRYLSSQFRIRARTANYLQPFKVRTLIEELGCKIDLRHPEKTKVTLEKTLDSLREDKVIAGWDYANGTESFGRKWLQEWLCRSVFIEPTTKELSAYRAISEKRGQRAHTLELFDRFMDKNERSATPKTRLQLAEIINVPPRDLLLYEHGKPVLSTVNNRIKRWLETEAS
jgi:hypothetical protein